MAKHKLELSISFVALILSIVATVSSIYFSNIGMKTNVLPSMAFVYENVKGWSVRNVGNGPALNVIIAHQNQGTDTWIAPTRLYPVPKDETVHIRWVGLKPSKLMAIYTDVQNRSYITITDKGHTVIQRGTPSMSWQENEIKNIWERQ